MTTQLDRIEMMLFAQSTVAGLTQWITGWVAGENEGGMMVALYGKGGQFPACKVYSEKFYMLPDFVQQAIPQTAQALPANRSGAERAGRLVSCHPFQIVRYRYGDDEKAKWRLGGVLRVAKDADASTQTAVAQTQPTPVIASPPAAGQPASTNPMNDRYKPGLFQVGDEVLVKGNHDEKPGTIKGINGDDLFTVAVAGKRLVLGADKLSLIAMA